MIKKISLGLLIFLYATAGINHFIHPAFYYRIIPPYFPYPVFINMATGVAELLAACLLAFSTTRLFAVYFIIVMLVCFIPTHIYMIQMRVCPDNLFCFTYLVAWLRLFPLQFILIWWAWMHRK